MSGGKRYNEADNRCTEKFTTLINRKQEQFYAHRH